MTLKGIILLMLQRHLFHFLFYLLLVLDVCFYRFFVKPNRAHAISFCPKVSPPISLFQIRVPCKYPYRAFSFYIPHYLCNRIFRRKRYYHVYVVVLHVSRYYLYLFPCHSSFITPLISPHISFFNIRNRYFGHHTI